MLHALAPLLRRRGSLLFRADFTTQSVGGGSVSSYGLSFSRASSGHSVRTGTSTVATGGSIANNDVPRFGRALDANPVAFVIEQTSQNLNRDNRDCSTAQWNGGVAVTTTANAATSPDGQTLATRHQVGSGGFSRHSAITPGANGDFAFTCWHKEGSVGVSGQRVYYVNNFGLKTAIGGTEPSVWTCENSVTLNRTVSTIGIMPAEGRTDSIAAGARDELTDFHQIESGKIPTEVIINANAQNTRAGERLYRATGSSLLTSTGALRLYVKLRPKGSSSQYANDMRFWHVDANNHAEVVASTGAVNITIGGTAYTTATAATWSANDPVGFWIAAGGGVVATVVKYRIDTGSVVTLSTGSPPTQAAITISGACDLLCNGTANQFTSRVERLEFHPNNSTPTGF